MAQAGVTVASALLVSGDTFAIKDQLKALGGTWVKSSSSWLLAADKRAELDVLLGKQPVKQEVKQEADGALPASSDAESSAAASSTPSSSTPSSSAPALQPSTNANANLTIAPHKRAVLVTGDTLNVKDQLKSLGGSWNRGLKGWVFPGSKKAAVLALLNGDPTNTVSEHSAAPSPAAKRQKKDDFIDDDFIDDDE